MSTGQQFFFLIVSLLLGCVVQLLLFKSPENTWVEALLTWQGLWVFYYLIGYAITRRLFRHSPPRLDRS